MKSVLPEPKLRELWQDIEKQAGSFQKRLGTRMEVEQGYQVVFVTCQFERTNLDMKVVFDSQRHVAGLFYFPCQKAK
jgi:hypothetical protein